MKINNIKSIGTIILLALIQPVSAQQNPKVTVSIIVGQLVPPIMENGKRYYSNSHHTLLVAEVSLDGGPIREEDPESDVEYRWDSLSGVPLTPKECTGVKFGPFKNVVASTLGIAPNVGYSFQAQAKVVLANGKILFPRSPVATLFYK